MSNIAKLEFAALEATGRNYMPWTIDVEMHLEAMGIRDTINFINDCSIQDKAKAHVFLRKHIDDMLKTEYLSVSDPNILWTRLKERFDHQREIMLPKARNEWMTLRFQDFKKVNEYNSALFRICSTLKFCGEEISEDEMLEKTYSTFHASNITLMQQYRMQRFTRYSELNACLLVAEQNNELLMKNHESRPTGSVALPEVNATSTHEPRNIIRGRGRGRGRGQGRGRGRGRGRGHNNFNQNHHHGNYHPYNRGRSYSYHRGRGRGNNDNHHNSQGNNAQPQNKEHDTGTSQNPGGSCYRCGDNNHWSRTCRTPPHLCKLYQDSIKRNGKGKEVNLIDRVEFDNTELNAADFSNEMEDIN